MKATTETLGEHSFDKCRVMVLLKRGNFACYEFEYSETFDILKLLREIDYEHQNNGHCAKVVFVPAAVILMISALYGSLITMEKNVIVPTILEQIGIFEGATFVGYNPKIHVPKIELS
jgi:hypothetical protein